MQNQSAAPWEFSEPSQKNDWVTTGLLYNVTQAVFYVTCQARRENLAPIGLSRTYRDLIISYFRDPAAANQALTAS